MITEILFIEFLLSVCLICGKAGKSFPKVTG